MKKKIIIGSIIIILIIVIGLVISKYNEKKKCELCLKYNNNIALCVDYINDYPEGKYIESAKQRHDSLIWLDARKINTYTSYENYLSQSYSKKNREMSDSLGEEAFWRDAIKVNSINNYEDYNKTFPYGKYISISNNKIEEFLWKQLSQEKKRSQIDNYLQRFPKGKYINLAQVYLVDNVWESLTKNPKTTKSEYEAFISNYPNGKYKQNAINKIQLLNIAEQRKTDLSWLYGNWVDINNTNVDIDISQNKNIQYGTSATRYFGTYTIEDSKIIFKAIRLITNSVVYSSTSVSGSYISGKATDCDAVLEFIIDFENLTLSGEERVFKKK
jgi:hypothetical protein